MTRLLSAGFLRLKKNKVFWGGLILMAAWGIFVPVKMHMDAVQSGYTNNIENAFFGCAIFVGIVMAVFCSMFIGTEYNDGTIRNKIIVGGKRWAIYLANMAVSCVVGVVLCVAYMIPYLFVGMPLLGAFTAPGEMVLLTMLTVLLFAVALSDIFITGKSSTNCLKYRELAPKSVAIFLKYQSINFEVKIPNIYSGALHIL